MYGTICNLDADTMRPLPESINSLGGTACMILIQNFQGADQLWESRSCIIFEVTPCTVHATFDSSLPCCFNQALPDFNMIPYSNDCTRACLSSGTRSKVRKQDRDIRHSVRLRSAPSFQDRQLWPAARSRRSPAGFGSARSG
jgi:hypothetical protein